MRGARPFGGRLGIDDDGAVDAACAFLGRGDRIAFLADIDGVLDMDRPVAAGPPRHRAGLEIVAGAELHATVSAIRAQRASLCSASLRSPTSPPTVIAGRRNIRRTSGRKRVCQYELILVVRVTVNNNNSTNLSKEIH